MEPTEAILPATLYLPIPDEARAGPRALETWTAGLIADLGQPKLPGWEVVIALLMAATIAAAIASQQPDQLRRLSRRHRAPVERHLPLRALRFAASPNAVRLAAAGNIGRAA